MWKSVCCNTQVVPAASSQTPPAHVTPGLFRWATNGFMTDKAWHQKATAEMKEQRQKDDAERSGIFLDMFTTYEELIE